MSDKNNFRSHKSLSVFFLSLLGTLPLKTLHAISLVISIKVIKSMFIEDGDLILKSSFFFGLTMSQ